MGFGRTAMATAAVSVVLPLVPVMVILPVWAAAAADVVRVAVADAPGFTLVGEKVRVTPVGVLAVRATALLKLPVAVTATVKVTDLPGGSDSGHETEGFRVNPGAGAVEPLPIHPYTSRWASTEPRPVARL